MLEMEGLLEAIPRVRYRVKRIEWDEVEEICAIRAVNESLAARWVMKRITPKELQELEDNLTVAELEVKEKDPKSFITRDAEFHEILVRTRGGERLLELCQTLRRHMLRYRIESLYLPETLLRAIKGHFRIVDCVREKDESGVEVAIREHLEQSKCNTHQYAFLESDKKDSALRGENK